MPPKKPQRVKRAQHDRLAHIERLLWWRGWVRRKDLIGAFGVSELQASHDLKEYRSRHPGVMRYDQKAARYAATAELKRSDDEGNLEEAARILALLPRPAGTGPWVGRVLLPARRAESKVARAVVRAILSGQSLHVRYASVHSNTFRWRWITPHALGHDGWRWHVRSYCADEHGFRDFVLGRIAETGDFGPAAARPEDDSNWATETTIRVKPNPALGATQRRALELDFTMRSGALTLKGAPALLHYALANLGLSENGRPLAVRFVTAVAPVHS